MDKHPSIVFCLACTAANCTLKLWVDVTKDFRNDSLKKKKWGPDRDLNPGPLAPEARIIPLDHQATTGETFELLLIFLQPR